MVDVIAGRIFITCHHVSCQRESVRLVAWDHVTEIQEKDERECYIKWTGDQGGDAWVVSSSMARLTGDLHQANRRAEPTPEKEQADEA